jgi:oligopeptidase B
LLYILGIVPFENYISIFGRLNGTERIWLSTVTTTENVTTYSDWVEIPIDESTYSIWLSQNWVYSSDNLRLGYSSFLTPKQIFDYNMKTGLYLINK